MWVKGYSLQHSQRMALCVENDLVKVQQRRTEQQIQVLNRLRREKALHPIVRQSADRQHIGILSISELRLAVPFDRLEDLIPPLSTRLSSLHRLHVDGVLRHPVQQI